MNSEARRHNSLIRTSTLDEPLRSLLRPLPPPVVPSTPLSGNTVVPSPPSTLGPNVNPTSPPQEIATLPDLRVNSRFDGLRGPLMLVLPTPSPLFPHDLPSLMKLGAEEVATLARDYGLLPSHPSERGSSGAEGRKEENLNRFLSYIGVSFKLSLAPTAKFEFHALTPHRLASN